MCRRLKRSDGLRKDKSGVFRELTGASVCVEEATRLTLMVSLLLRSVLSTTMNLLHVLEVEARLGRSRWEGKEMRCHTGGAAAILERMCEL